MAAQRTAERGYHQDYIARIRYENTLPPPPGAPKLLNIPIEGLQHYTSAAFSSRMARQQPLNIEADAELGMPIDLVGMPGIFDGDESCMTAMQCPLNDSQLMTAQQFKRLCPFRRSIPKTRTSFVLYPSLASPNSAPEVTAF